MTAQVQAALGCRIYIGTTATVGSSDTYTEIGEVTNIGEFGTMYDEIKHTPLATGYTQKYKGIADDGDLEVDVARNASDAGQAAAITALSTKDDYNFKITLNDTPISGTTPTKFIFKAKVMSYRTTVAGVQSIVGAKMRVSIKTGSIAETIAV